MYCISIPSAMYLSFCTQIHVQFIYKLSPMIIPGRNQLWQSLEVESELISSKPLEFLLHIYMYIYIFIYSVQLLVQRTSANLYMYFIVKSIFPFNFPLNPWIQKIGSSMSRRTVFASLVGLRKGATCSLQGGRYEVEAQDTIDGQIWCNVTDPIIHLHFGQ